jgi:hypothetical protein
MDQKKGGERDNMKHAPNLRRWNVGNEPLVDAIYYSKEVTVPSYFILFLLLAFLFCF